MHGQSFKLATERPGKTEPLCHKHRQLTRYRIQLPSLPCPFQYIIGSTKLASYFSLSSYTDFHKGTSFLAAKINPGGPIPCFHNSSHSVAMLFHAQKDKMLIECINSLIYIHEAHKGLKHSNAIYLYLQTASKP